MNSYYYFNTLNESSLFNTAFPTSKNHYLHWKPSILNVMTEQENLGNDCGCGANHHKLTPFMEYCKFDDRSTLCIYCSVAPSKNVWCVGLMIGALFLYSLEQWFVFKLFIISVKIVGHYNIIFNNNIVRIMSKAEMFPKMRWVTPST